MMRFSQSFSIFNYIIINNNNIVVINYRYDVDCVVANILMTRYQEIRLVFSTKSVKNATLQIHAVEKNEEAEVELVTRDSELPLEADFVPRLIYAHQQYLKSL